ncbi:uncharacterized protein LOC117150583 [Drosophila mauritiana]|uniref:Uncharacterized protein LOC117150583 n=1 Tax=Drosophila mauritiana TaxID=7226 RepID=A0A6P8KW95_DROMA|nr:uncharacterized protein LOC117150583 [Drosophila mauritiana]XP_033173429.1 uncharacterized protein LOC117150583 [Drosophila mauritiana]
MVTEAPSSDIEDSLLQTSDESVCQIEITAMDGLQYAVEFAHDDNLLGSRPSNVSQLSEFLAMLTLNAAEERQDDGQNFHNKLLQLKREADLLATKFDSPDYYTRKEELIFKVVCELRGIDHEKWLLDEMGLMDEAAFGDILRDAFVCNGD